MTKKPTLGNGLGELERKRQMHLDAAKDITLNDDAAIQAHIRLAGVVDRLIKIASQHKGED
jgi:hypothetical protein